MAIRGNSITVTYTAWNTSTNAGQTGDAANHTIKLVKDGTSATATNTPAEVDAVNAPGQYKLVVTATEMTCDTITLCGKSATANVVIIPISITTEHGVLPNIQQGNAGAVITSGTGTAQLNVTSGIADANLKQVLGGACPATTVTGVPKVDVADWLGTTVTAATAGIPDINVKNINNAAVSTTVAQVGVNVVNYAGVAAAVDANNLPKVDVEDWRGTAPNTLNAGRVDALTSIRSNNCGTGSTASNVVLDAGASNIDNTYIDCLVLLTSGTGAGQVRSIQSYTGASQTANIFPNWNTTPLNTTSFAIIPMGQVDVGNWLNGTIPSPNVTGVPKVDLVDISGAAVSTAAAQLGVNVVNIGGSGSVGAAGYVGVDWGQVTNKTATNALTNTTISTSQVVASVSGSVNSVTSLVSANVTQWNGAAVAVPNIAGIPKVDVTDWSGTAVAGALPPDSVFLHSGTAVSGSTTTIKLDAGASSTDNYYTNAILFIYSGTGAGQSALINGYTGLTQTASFSSTLAVAPASGSKFAIIPFGAISATVSGTVTVSDYTAGKDPASYILVTPANKLETDATGKVDVSKFNGQAVVLDAHNLLEVDVQDWAGTAVSATTAGIPDINVKNINNAAVNTAAAQMGVNIVNIGGSASTGVAGYVGIDWSHINAPTTAQNLSNTTISTTQAVASVSGSVGSIAANGITNASLAVDTGFKPIRTGTAQAGAATSIKLDLGASATDNIYNGSLVVITGNTGAGQARLITSYTGINQTANVDFAWTVNPDVTSTFALLPGGYAALNSSFQVTAASVQGNVTGSVNSVTSLVSANVTQWNGSAVAVPNIAGVPKVDVTDWLGSAPNALISGRIDSSTGAMATNVITATALSSGATAAITTAILTDTTASDFTVVGSPGKVLVGQLGGTFTTTSSSVFSGPALVNALTGSAVTVGGYSPGQDPASWVLVTPANKLLTDVAGRVDVSKLNGNVVQLDASNLMKVDVADWGGTAVFGTLPPDINILHAGTAVSGTGTTIRLDAGASSTDNYYNNTILFIYSGTGAGQSALINGYAGGTQTASFSSTLATPPAAGSKFAIVPFGAISATVSGNVTVADYTAGKDPASYILANPNNKLTTDASGSVQIQSGTGPGQLNLTSGNVTVSQILDKTGYSLAAAGLDSISIESSLNARQAIAIIAASAAGQLTLDNARTTVTIYAAGSGTTTARISATVDAYGNRKVVTLTPPV